jgi:solute carrier family 27 (fatty acid transporter), member 1/4
VKRFKVKRVTEFYGATEGNANIGMYRYDSLLNCININSFMINFELINFNCISVNVDNKEGAIGFVSRIIPNVYPIAILRVDQETGEPIRNKKGLCMVSF